jgi:hypothetical protein
MQNDTKNPRQVGSHDRQDQRQRIVSNKIADAIMYITYCPVLLLCSFHGGERVNTNRLLI